MVYEFILVIYRVDRATNSNEFSYLRQLHPTRDLAGGRVLSFAYSQQAS